MASAGRRAGVERDKARIRISRRSFPFFVEFGGYEEKRPQEESVR